jgi:hypothetical protein
MRNPNARYSCGSGRHRRADRPDRFALADDWRGPVIRAERADLIGYASPKQAVRSVAPTQRHGRLAPRPLSDHRPARHAHVARVSRRRTVARAVWDLTRGSHSRSQRQTAGIGQHPATLSHCRCWSSYAHQATSGTTQPLSALTSRSPELPSTMGGSIATFRLPRRPYESPLLRIGWRTVDDPL